MKRFYGLTIKDILEEGIISKDERIAVWHEDAFKEDTINLLWEGRAYDIPDYYSQRKFIKIFSGPKSSMINIEVENALKPTTKKELYKNNKNAIGN